MKELCLLERMLLPGLRFVSLTCIAVEGGVLRLRPSMSLAARLEYVQWLGNLIACQSGVAANCGELLRDIPAFPGTASFWNHFPLRTTGTRTCRSTSSMGREAHDIDNYCFPGASLALCSACDNYQLCIYAHPCPFMLDYVVTRI